MDDRSEIVRELSQPLASGRGWMKFLGILAIVAGVLQALTIVGIIIAWLPIWLGVLLFQAASAMEQASISGDTAAFVTGQNRLRLFFTTLGVLVIIEIALIALAFFFLGTAGIAALMSHHVSPAL